jgi:hypothetical protein
VFGVDQLFKGSFATSKPLKWSVSAREVYVLSALSTRLMLSRSDVPTLLSTGDLTSRKFALGHKRGRRRCPFPANIALPEREVGFRRVSVFWVSEQAPILNHTLNDILRGPLQVLNDDESGTDWETAWVDDTSGVASQEAQWVDEGNENSTKV